MNGMGQGAPILQSHLPFTPWGDPALSRLPGMTPVSGNWIVVDDVYAAQMAEKSRLLAAERDTVIQTTQGSELAQAELLETVIATLPSEFERDGQTIRCPDGREVSPNGAPFDVLGALLQEDLILLQRASDEHVLTAALLCFPASWTLKEKIGRPLGRIHAPVPEYDMGLAERVQNLFDRVQPGRAMWRANALGYACPNLHHPRTETAPRRPEPARYLRCERQTVLRLPRTQAVVFAVHTYVLRPDALTSTQRHGCPVMFAS